MASFLTRRDPLCLSRCRDTLRRGSFHAGRAAHRPRPGRVGHHVRGDHRIPAARPAAARRHAARAARRPAAARADPAPAAGRMVVAVGRARRAQHRVVLRAAVRQRVPAAGRDGGRARRGTTAGRRGADRASADRASGTAYGARRSARCRRRDARRAHRRGPFGRRRPRGRPGRHRVDGARPGAHQALGTAGRVAADHDRLAADRGRPAAGAGRRPRRRCAGPPHRRQRGRVRLPLGDRHGSGVLAVVPGVEPPAGRPGLAARTALPAGRDRPRMGGARAAAHTAAGDRHGRRVRGRRLGISAGPRSPRCAPGSRSGRLAASPGRGGRWW